MSDFKKIKIVLVDDNDLFREGIKRILEGSEFFDIVGVGNKMQSVEELTGFEPDIILIDLDMYIRSNLDYIKGLISEYPQLKLVLFTEQLGNHQMLTAFDHGVRGYLTKDMNVSSLIDALKAIQAGKFWIHSSASDTLVREYLYAMSQSDQEHMKGPAYVSRPVDLFTNREYQVLQLLATGYNNQKIAAKLDVTQSTVKNHVTSIFVKMNVSDRTQAVIKAIQNNWVEVHYGNPETV